MISRPKRGAIASQSGYSILEVLIAALITGLVVGGVLNMMGSAQYAHQDLDGRLVAQQGSRMAMEQIQRDLTLAGVGLAPMSPVFPFVIPRVDGGVDLRINRGAITSFLSQDTTDQRTIRLASVAGFSVGQTVAVYDAAGSLELVTIDFVNGGGGLIRVVPDLTRNYLVTDGTAVARVQQISYFTQTVSGVQMLMRQVDGATANPVATDITGFAIRYFDDSTPPVLFTPTTAVQQLLIRSVEVEMTLQAPRERIQAGDRPTFTARTRISPRALMIQGG